MKYLKLSAVGVESLFFFSNWSSVAERSLSLCNRLKMFIKPMPQPILRKRG